MNAAQVYDGSDGSVTTTYYNDLRKFGPAGEVALNLFRAQKCSARAKKYRGGIRGVGSYKGMAYDRKEYSLRQLCSILAEHGEKLSIIWGWKPDPDVVFGNKTSWVLYVDIPTGQVSFHNPKRLDGPRYEGDWDGERKSCERILAFCDLLTKAFEKINPALTERGMEPNLFDGNEPCPY